VIPLHNLRGFTRRHFTRVRNFHGGRRIKTGAGGLNRPTQRAEAWAAAGWHHRQAIIVHWTDYQWANTGAIWEGHAIGFDNELKTFVARNSQRYILIATDNLTGVEFDRR